MSPPTWSLPTAVQHLSEPASIELAQQIQTVAVTLPTCSTAITTPYVRAGVGAPPLLLLHGFDSSLLEFRRLLPHLASQTETWLVDLLGFGFSDRTAVPALSPATIKSHLYQVWQQLIQQPVVLVGASMGGATAIDFALTYPAAVAGLILIDSAGFAAGPALGRWMVPPLDRWATAFLRNPGVRRQICRQTFFNPALVTPDVELCASLHLDCPQWAQALIAFTKSGGYNFLQDKIAAIPHPSLIIWGRQDKILGTRDADRFQRTLIDNRLVWIEHCGHVPHLEKSQETAQAILDFIQRFCPNLPVTG